MALTTHSQKSKIYNMNKFKINKVHKNNFVPIKQTMFLIIIRFHNHSILKLDQI